MRPEALIHSEAMQLVSDACALELASGNMRWRDVSELLVQMHERQMRVIAALKELSTPPKVPGTEDVLPRTLALTGIEKVMEAYGITAEAPPEPAESKAAGGQVASTPTI